MRRQKKSYAHHEQTGRKYDDVVVIFVCGRAGERDELKKMTPFGAKTSQDKTRQGKAYKGKGYDGTAVGTDCWRYSLMNKQIKSESIL